jgi:hypothetical protein
MRVAEAVNINAASLSEEAPLQCSMSRNSLPSGASSVVEQNDRIFERTVEIIV